MLGQQRRRFGAAGNHPPNRGLTSHCDLTPDTLALRSGLQGEPGASRLRSFRSPLTRPGLALHLLNGALTKRWLPLHRLRRLKEARRPKASRSAIGPLCPENKALVDGLTGLSARPEGGPYSGC
jgi:hypothetical protein